MLFGSGLFAHGFLYNFYLTELNAGPAAMGAAAASLYEYFSGFLTDRRSKPREDLISALVQAEVNGERLTYEEDLDFFLRALDRARGILYRPEPVTAR